MADQHRFEHQRMTASVVRDRALPRSRFDDVNLSDAVFSNVNLQRTHVTNVDLRDVTIDDARIEGLTVLGYNVSTLIRTEVLRRG